MILIAIFFPLGVLCLYLGCLSWRKNQVVSVVLLIFALASLSFAIALATRYFYL